MAALRTVSYLTRAAMLIACAWVFSAAAQDSEQSAAQVVETAEASAAQQQEPAQEIELAGNVSGDQSDNASDNASGNQSDKKEASENAGDAESAQDAESTQEDDSDEESGARFIPTEEISQDFGVSFPVDI